MICTSPTCTRHRCGPWGAKASEAASAGRPVLIDAPCLAEIGKAAAAGVSLDEHLQYAYGFPPLFTVWVTAPESERRRRMTERGAARDQAKLADWEGYCAVVQEQLAGTGIASLVDAVRET